MEPDLPSTGTKTVPTAATKAAYLAPTSFSVEKLTVSPVFKVPVLETVTAGKALNGRAGLEDGHPVMNGAARE